MVFVCLDKQEEKFVWNGRVTLSRHGKMICTGAMPLKAFSYSGVTEVKEWHSSNENGRNEVCSEI